MFFLKIIVLFSDFPKKIFSKVYVVHVFSVKHLDVSGNNHTFAKIPTALQMAKVYKRLIITRVHTMSPLLTLQGAILPVASDEMLNYSPSCSWQ